MREQHNPALVTIAGVHFDPADGERWARCDNPNWPYAMLVITHRDRRPLRIIVRGYDAVEVGEINAGIAQVDIYCTGTALDALQAVEEWRKNGSLQTGVPGSKPAKLT